MKQNKGITLIALVVTIIVLLILAGVAIAMLRGDNGILNRASESRYQNIISTFDEQVKLGYMSVKTSISAKRVSETGYIATKDATSLKDLADEVANGLGVTATTGSNKGIETGNYTVEYYLDDAGSTTNNGDGYIVVWYTDNALRSSLPFKTDAERAKFIASNNLIASDKATTKSRNQFALAAVIHVTNYNCSLSSVYATSTTEGDADRKLSKFAATGAEATLYDASEMKLAE